MAQVIRKFQKAGTFGSVIFDGKKYEVDEDWIKDLENHSPQGRAWAEQLRSGNDQYLYTHGDGFNFAHASDEAREIADLNDRQEKKMGLENRGGRKVRREKQN